MAQVTYQREGALFSTPVSAVTGYASNSTNGFYRTAYGQGKWTGVNLTYTEGIFRPTGGTLYSYTEFDSSGWEVMSVTGLNYQLSGPDSFNPIAALLATSESKKEPIYVLGGRGDDVLAWLGSHLVDTFIDGGSGFDTLSLSQNYANYSVTDYNASLGTLTLYSSLAKRDADVKFVESFRFNDRTISFEDLSATGGRAPSVAAPTSAALVVDTSMSGTQNEIQLKLGMSIGELSDGRVDGTNSRDTMRGTDGHDVLYAGKGDDTVYGGKGGDLLNGGDGDDAIYGGKDDDVIYGSKGNDQCPTSACVRQIGVLD